MHRPLVSVVVPTYNRAHYLAATVDSALAQAPLDLEVIIVDDGSTDDTPGLVERQAAVWGRRVRYFRQPNSERGAARNQGLLVALGEFVAFLDSDDLWRPGHLRACLAELERHPEAVAAYGEYGLIDGEGSIIRDHVPRPVHAGDSLIRDLCLKRLILHPSEVVLRRSLLPSGPLFEVDVNGAEDWLLWVTLADRSPFRSLGIATVWMRSHPRGTFGEPAKFARGLSRAAERVVATGIPERAGVRAGRIRRINQVHCAYVYYLSGRWAEAFRHLKSAWGSDPGVIREPDFWRVVFRLGLGRALSRRIRAVRNRPTGAVVEAGAQA